MTARNPLSTDATGNEPRISPEHPSAVQAASGADADQSGAPDLTNATSRIVDFRINAPARLVGSALVADGFATITTVDLDGAQCTFRATEISLDLFGDDGELAATELEPLLDADCRVTLTGTGTIGEDGLFDGVVQVAVGPRQILRTIAVLAL